MTNNDKQNWQVLFATILLTAGISVLWLVSTPMTDDDIRMPTRHTAQLAFALYIVILVARPLQQLLRKDWTATLLRKRRLIGVAFAAVMTTHLGLIAYRFGTQPELEYPLFNLMFGGTAYALFYLMLITSFDAPKKALGPKKWKLLHRTGLVWAALIFGLPRSFDELTDPEYLKFGIPFVIALVIRFTAWRRSRRRGS